MRLYLDDDSAQRLSIRLLVRAGHDVIQPADLGLVGENDPVHLRQAIHERRAILSHNFEDFEELHALVLESQGHHHGILIVRKDNDPSRDMQPAHIVRALRNLEGAGVTNADQFIILNHWR